LITFFLSDPPGTFKGKLGYKTCGFSIVSGVQWARDRNRSDAWLRGVEKGEEAINRSIVYKCDGWGKLKVGFSVEDPQAFMDALETVERGITTRDPFSDKKISIVSEVRHGEVTA
jgi:hypothetical protein